MDIVFPHTQADLFPVSVFSVNSVVKIVLWDDCDSLPTVLNHEEALALLDASTTSEFIHSFRSQLGPRLRHQEIVEMLYVDSAEEPLRWGACPFSETLSRTLSRTLSILPLYVRRIPPIPTLSDKVRDKVRDKVAGWWDACPCLVSRAGGFSAQSIINHVTPCALMSRESSASFF